MARPQAAPRRNRVTAAATGRPRRRRSNVRPTAT